MSTQIVEDFAGAAGTSDTISVLRWAASSNLDDCVMYTITVDDGMREPMQVVFSRRQMVELISKLVDGLVV